MQSLVSITILLSLQKRCKLAQTGVPAPLKTFKAAFMWCVGVRKSQFRYLCKVVSKNRSEQSCALTFANCIRRSFSKKANQTRETSVTIHINPPSKRALLCTSSEYSSQQSCTASSDCFRLVTKVSLSVQILSTKKIQLNKNNHYSEKVPRPLNTYF